MLFKGLSILLEKKDVPGAMVSDVVSQVIKALLPLQADPNVPKSTLYQLFWVRR
jgi:hypothetical protein